VNWRSKAHGVTVDCILRAKSNNYLFVVSKAKFTVSTKEIKVCLLSSGILKIPPK
jgi:hypothetical protein